VQDEPGSAFVAYIQQKADMVVRKNNMHSIVPFILLYIRNAGIGACIVFSLYSCGFSEGATRRKLKKNEHTSFDVIVVPGVPPDSMPLHWGRIMKARVYWSKFLYDRGIAKNIIYSGGAQYSPYYESRVMAMYGEAIGIPREHIFTEDLAEHSTENIYYGVKLARKLGFKTIALASDPFQTGMLRTYTWLRIKQKVALLPLITDTLRAMEPSMINPVIDYSKAYKKDFVPLKERESGWKRFMGTMGFNRNRKAYE